MTMTAEMIAFVETFAKSSKVNRTKTLEMAQTLVSMMPVQVVSNSGAGKPLSNESKELRTKLREFGMVNKGKTFIVPELTKQMNTDMPTLNNNLRAMAKDGLFKVTGDKIATGKPGKRPIVWTAI